MKQFRTSLTASALLASALLLGAQLPQAVKPDRNNKAESWTTLSLKGSDFTPIPPLLGQTDNQATFTRELLRVQWRPYDPIDLYVVIPKLAPKPPAILYLYNYTTNTDRFMRANICKYLSEGGVAAVGFSLALSGYRFHDRGAYEWFVSNFQEALATSAHDIQLVINYLETRKDIDTSRIGIYGQGSGAAVAVLAASVDPRIKALDLEDTWGDWPDWLAKSSIIPEAERPTYLKPGFLKTVAGLDPIDYLPKLKIPVRNQYSLPESPVPSNVRQRIQAALPPQAAHTPIEKNFNWLKSQLQQMRD